jgi:hypothetical protein
MNKSLIHLRKKLWLPIKYKFLRRKYIRESGMRSKAEVWDQIQLEKKNLLKAQCGMDFQEVDRIAAIIKTLNWFLNGSSNE